MIKNYFSYLKPSYIFTSIVLTILTAITSMIITMSIGEALVIPPIIEELSKLLAITYNFHFAIIYTLVFSIMEFVDYTIMYSGEYGEVDRHFLLIRGLCIIIHLIYLKVQIKGFQLFYKTKWRGYIILSFISACILHIAWNGIFGKIAYLFIVTFL